MRLFIAINFEEEDKERLYHNIIRLKEVTKKASFTQKENLHLTLVFIGETKRRTLIEEIIAKSVDESNTRKLLLDINGFGVFNRREGDISWLGFRRNEELNRLYHFLNRNLKDAGFKIEDREYTPHLTLSRRTIFDKNFNQKDFEAETFESQLFINKISLMKSERIEGKLVYTEIYFYNLRDENETYVSNSNQND